MKLTKPSASSHRSSSSNTAPGPRARFTSYASAARSTNMTSATPTSPAPLSTSMHKDWSITTSDSPAMFSSLLAENTTDPQALAVQDYLHQFISRSVQRSHGEKLDSVCARVDDMTISTASRMQATDDLIQESNTRISSLMTTQAANANSLTTLERILIQQSESLNHQLELMKSITSNKLNESSVTISQLYLRQSQ